MWKSKASLKFRLFFWLALSKKVLTWDVLQKRAWKGPSYYMSYAGVMMKLLSIFCWIALLQKKFGRRFLTELEAWGPGIDHLQLKDIRNGWKTCLWLTMGHFHLWFPGVLGSSVMLFFFKRNPSPGLNLYKIKYLYDDIKMVPRAKSPRQIGSNGIGKTNPYSYLDGASQGKSWTMSCWRCFVCNLRNSFSFKVGLEWS